MKKGLSSLELTAIVNELQFLVSGKIAQIYQQEKEALWLQLHMPGKGKLLLKIVPGRILCLTDKKERVFQPSSFCLQLRKHLDQAIIRNLYQKEAERVVVLELEKENK